MFTLNRFYFLIVVFSVSGEVRTLSRRDVLLSFSDGCQKLYIEIVVSPLQNKNNLYRLKVQWESVPNKEGDWIGIFQANPKTGKVLLEPIYVIKIRSKKGWNHTSVYEKYINPEKLGYEGKCLDYYAGYFDKCHFCLAVTCLRIEPDWMWSLRGNIGSKKIHEVVIPGTHESAWYRVNLKKYVTSEPFLTQSEGILRQLIHGARYLHMTVSYQSSAKKKSQFWASYYSANLHPLTDIFDEVHTFITNTDEIVIIDIREFSKGFEDEAAHRLLIKLMMKKFQDLLAINTLSWDSTLNNVWVSGRRLIIAYNSQLAVKNSLFLWNSIEHVEYVGENVDSLQDFIAEYMDSPPQSAWSANANFKVLRGDITEDIKNRSTYLLADKINYNITSWFRKESWLSSANIVSVDFIRNTGIVRSILEWNSEQCT